MCNKVLISVAMSADRFCRLRVNPHHTPTRSQINMFIKLRRSEPEPVLSARPILSSNAAHSSSSFSWLNHWAGLGKENWIAVFLLAFSRRAPDKNVWKNKDMQNISLWSVFCISVGGTVFCTATRSSKSFAGVTIQWLRYENYEYLWDNSEFNLYLNPERSQLFRGLFCCYMTRFFHWEDNGSLPPLCELSRDDEPEYNSNWLNRKGEKPDNWLFLLTLAINFTCDVIFNRSVSVALHLLCGKLIQCLGAW